MDLESAGRAVLRTLFAACLFLAAPALAQTYDVVGLVMDAEKGEPIGQARVETKSGKLLGFSKSNGRFEVTVNSRGAVLVFKRHTYKDIELDLADLPELVDLEVNMETAVIELAAKDTVARRGPARDPGAGSTIDELEQMQGMRIDINDHLRQLPGVSGMGEFTGDISVWGSRTHDVTHYLGQTRIPSLRHLDFGFPGNQSVLNPRLLKSITVADNLARGPLNQGNSSALVYDLKEGDPNNIHGDLVFGTVNRELNLTGYWEDRTFVASGRFLQPTFLGNLGEKFFTEAKDARLQGDAAQCDTTLATGCKELSDAFDFLAGDLYVGTFYRDSTGAFGRHSLIGVDDNFTVRQDMADNLGNVEPQTLVSGTQGAWMYAYEGLSPHRTGDLSYAFSVLRRKREESFGDTLNPAKQPDVGQAKWYPISNGRTDYLLGHTDAEDLQTTASFQWNSGERLWGATYGHGLDFEFLSQERQFRDIADPRGLRTLPQDYALANGLFRLRWTLGSRPASSGSAGPATLDAALGASLVYQALLDGEDAGVKTPAPIASLRYTRPFSPSLSGYGEMALRANTALEPVGYNALEAYTTSSAEAKLGALGALGEDFQFTSSVYARVYRDPRLPVPEVLWNYAETQESDYAYAGGVNMTFGWSPSHHFGMNLNASSVQGDYHLTDGEYLPWESNRTLDMVTNFRIVPRKDSLLSLIITYTANNGAPLYEYTGTWDGSGRGSHTRQRTVRSSRDWETVSRQRTDARINLDLPSRFKPLSNVRFFCEIDNLFAEVEQGWVDWLGGDNERKRGWTRANAAGDLRPVVTRGMGLYLMFGFEGRLVL
ncbi:MAG TPA: hypothetical protein VK465_07445 [Fibrobacteria bacterium]|nr:hypothetical protein [Fibrobacteria bacterium]